MISDVTEHQLNGIHREITKTMEDARRMISQTDDPTAIMEIIGTQDHLDRLELIKENWDKVGGQYRT